MVNPMSTRKATQKESTDSSKPDADLRMPLEPMFINVETLPPPSARLPASQHVSEHAPQVTVHPISYIYAQPSQSQHHWLLVSHEALPTWYRDNVYIIDGYRAVSNSTAACFRSWKYVHNESVNIFTHLIASFLALTALLVIDSQMNKHYPKARLLDRLVLVFYAFATLVCMSISVGYHTMMCHSEGMSNLWLRLDILGIMFNIVGGFETANYFLFRCNPIVRSVYAGVFLMAVVLAKLTMLLPRLHGTAHRHTRLWIMIGVGAFTFIPFIHASIQYHWNQVNRQSGLEWYILEIGVLIVAAGLYQYRLPERWSPGRFDIWGASHQIFHVLIVISAVFHVIGLLTAFQYSYEHSCPAR